MNGLKIQWGYGKASGTSASHVLQFPISFSSTWFGVASNRQGWATGNINYKDNNHFFLTSAYGSGTGLSDNVVWLAIGY